MNRSQLIFSLASGLMLMAAGFALVTGGVADWGLFWVGALIAAVTLGTHMKSRYPAILHLTIAQSERQDAA